MYIKSIVVCGDLLLVMVESHIVVTLITSSSFLHLSHVFAKFKFYVMDLFSEIFCYRFQFCIEPFYNFFFIQFVFGFYLPQLRLHNSHSLFNLIIRNLRYHDFHFIFDFVHQHSLFLSIHWVTLVTLKHIEYVHFRIIIFSTVWKHCQHLLELPLDIQITTARWL